MFTLNKKIFLLLTLVIAGCTSDYKITEQLEEAEPGVEVPEIEVNPITHSFGALSAGSESQDVIVTIKNLGNGDLSLHDIYLHSGMTNFSITGTPMSVVEPLDEVELIITYSPGTYEVNSDIVSILSNDEDEPETLVVLDGSGDAPVITIDPDYYDFGIVDLGCDDTITVSVGNIGNSNLILSDIEYFSSLPVDFALQEYEDDLGTLPITIAPGDNIALDVDYIPLDSLDDSAYIEITSNDPIMPVAYADQDGLGDYAGIITDNFTQDGEVSADILFVVDNSGSMSSNQTNLKNNFGDFIAVFTAAGVDYHIALITTDDATFIGDVITSSDADPETEFNDQVDLIGYHGSAHEKGLWYSYVSTDAGGDAAIGSATAFFREAARLVIVYVSDEADYSHQTSGGGGSTSMAPSDYSAHLLSLKSSSDLVIAHAVAGDSPSGCTGNGGATFGDGYYDVVSDLGGTFMSICASDWSATMDTLARESMAELSYALSGQPVEDTITVSVDSVLSTDWTYDSSSNAVTFTVAPSDGSTIDITYAYWGCF